MAVGDKCFYRNGHYHALEAEPLNKLWRPTALSWSSVGRNSMAILSQWELSAPRRRQGSKSEPSLIVLRRDEEQALEAAAQCLLRTEAATLRDPFDRQA